MENWLQYKMMKSRQKFLKKGVIPHKNLPTCQNIKSSVSQKTPATICSTVVIRRSSPIDSGDDLQETSDYEKEEVEDDLEVIKIEITLNNSHESEDSEDEEQKYEANSKVDDAPSSEKVFSSFRDKTIASSNLNGVTVISSSSSDGEVTMSLSSSNEGTVNGKGENIVQLVKFGSAGEDIVNKETSKKNSNPTEKEDLESEPVCKKMKKYDLDIENEVSNSNVEKVMKLLNDSLHQSILEKAKIETQDASDLAELLLLQPKI